jgi:hypothetical protein
LRFWGAIFANRRNSLEAAVAPSMPNDGTDSAAKESGTPTRELWQVVAIRNADSVLIGDPPDW